MTVAPIIRQTMLHGPRAQLNAISLVCACKRSSCKRNHCRARNCKPHSGAPGRLTATRRIRWLRNFQHDPTISPANVAARSNYTRSGTEDAQLRSLLFKLLRARSRPSEYSRHVRSLRAKHVRPTTTIDRRWRIFRTLPRFLLRSVVKAKQISLRLF